MARIAQLAYQDGIEVRIPSQQTWVDLTLGPLLLLIFSPLVYYGYTSIMGSHVWEGLLALAGYATFVVRRGSAIGWCLFGKEVIRISSGGLEYSRSACGIGPVRSFLLQDITDMRINSEVPKFAFANHQPFRPVWGRIAFDCAGTTYTVALKVGETEATELIATLKPHLAAKPTASQSVENAPLQANPILAQKPTEVPRPMPVTDSSPTNSGIAFCTACGLQMTSPGKFCGQCGHPVPEEPLQIPDIELPAPVPPTAPQVVNPTPSQTVEVLGTMTQRLGAYFADACLVWLAAVAVLHILTNYGYLPTGESDAFDQFQLALLRGVLWIGYVLLAQGVYHTTVGKYAFDLELASSRERNSYPGFGTILLRETIGKFCSSIVFGIGLLQGIWDPRKQTWHDKMADTVVRERTTNPALRKQLQALAVVAVLVCIGVGLYQFRAAVIEAVDNQFESDAQECNESHDRVNSTANLAHESWDDEVVRDRQLLAQATEYGSHLEAMNKFTRRILLMHLYNGHDKYLYYSYSGRIYRLQIDANQKLRDEMQMLLKASHDQRDFQNTALKLAATDAEIANINKQINKLNENWREEAN